MTAPVDLDAIEARLNAGDGIDGDVAGVIIARCRAAESERERLADDLAKSRHAHDRDVGILTEQRFSDESMIERLRTERDAARANEDAAIDLAKKLTAEVARLRERMAMATEFWHGGMRVYHNGAGSWIVEQEHYGDDGPGMRYLHNGAWNDGQSTPFHDADAAFAALAKVLAP